MEEPENDEYGILLRLADSLCGRSAFGMTKTECKDKAGECGGIFD